MKRVEFNLNNNKEYSTYSIDEYDRMSIDSAIYQKSYKKISENEWRLIFVKLDMYKKTEMIVMAQTPESKRKIERGCDRETARGRSGSLTIAGCCRRASLDYSAGIATLSDRYVRSHLLDLIRLTSSGSSVRTSV
jgi:hypothetical protein